MLKAWPDILIHKLWIQGKVQSSIGALMCVDYVGSLALLGTSQRCIIWIMWCCVTSRWADSCNWPNGIVTTFSCAQKHNWNSKHVAGDSHKSYAYAKVVKVLKKQVWTEMFTQEHICTYTVLLIPGIMHIKKGVYKMALIEYHFNIEVRSTHGNYSSFLLMSFQDCGIFVLFSAVPFEAVKPSF